MIPCLLAALIFAGSVGTPTEWKGDNDARVLGADGRSTPRLPGLRVPLQDGPSGLGESAGSGSGTTPPVTAIRGTANYADPSHGRDYLAMRLPRGTKVTICGVECVDMTVNDYGPAESTHDIADIALSRFAVVCGWSVEKARRMGECDVEVEILSMSLPETDTED